MTGPEHYEEAERCLLEEGCEYGCPHSGCEHEMRLIARAQAHATLALAAPQQPAPLYSGCAFCDDFGAEDHVRCYCTRDCRKRGCGCRPAGGAS
jgi:hypothetical protein